MEHDEFERPELTYEREDVPPPEVLNDFEEHRATTLALRSQVVAKAVRLYCDISGPGAWCYPKEDGLPPSYDEFELAVRAFLEFRRTTPEPKP